MKAKNCLLFVMMLCISTSIKAQCIYTFQYKFTNIIDDATYNIFLERNDDGTGFYRVSFKDYDSHEDMIVNLKFKERYGKDANGNVDESKLYFQGYEPQVIKGKKDYVYYPEQIWFKKDPRTGYYEPWGITSKDEDQVAQAKFTVIPHLISQSELTQTLVSNYFTPDDCFYKNLFTVVPRGLSFDEKKTQLHLIVVANTDDPTIGYTCVLDKDRNVKMFKDLAQFMGIVFDPQVIYGDNYGKQNVLNTINALRPNAKDIVVFYYSGHGFKNLEGKSIYPDMSLTNSSASGPYDSSLNIEDVFKMIKAKGARFNLVYSDCCNNGATDLPTLTCDRPRTRSTALGWSLENCKYLFMSDKPMSILMTAAQKGEQSAGNGSDGGFFTSQFRTNLTTYFGPFHQFPDWNTIISDSKKTTTETANSAQCNKAGEAFKTYQQHPVSMIQ